MIVTIKHLRLRVRSTQEEVAKFLGYESATPYQRIEAGSTKKLKPEMRLRLAGCFKVSEKEVEAAFAASKMEAMEQGSTRKQVRVSLPRNRKRKTTGGK